MTLASDHMAAPLDAASTQRVAAAGLRWGITHVDGTEAEAWLQSVARGFLDSERDRAQLDATISRTDYRRKLGVYDDTAPVPEQPVATFATWASELTVPGGRSVASCAVSAVTVAPTHRRHGLARAMMEGELRVAAGLGFPVAMLTASEAVLYGRYGFGVAASVSSWKIRTRRAGWAGPVPDGRIDFISREQWRALAPELHERIRLSMPGEAVIPHSHWDTFAGTRPDAKEAGAIRTVQYRDAEGAVQGALAYRVTENETDYADSSVAISLLLAANDEAYAALWRFALTLDLIGTVSASELSVDEPLLHLLGDPRAAEISLHDHQYVRILDVAAALAGRSYAAAGELVLTVEDPLDIDGGVFRLVADEDGVGTVTRLADVPEGVPHVRLGTTELGMLYLGGTRAATLAKAGRITTNDARAVDDLFRSRETPRLSFWY